MPRVAEASPFISGQLRPAVDTGADIRSSTTRDFGREDVAREAWQRVLDMFSDWQHNPQQFDDEGVEPPTSNVIGEAIRCAQSFKNSGKPEPTTVVVDPNGGIVMERKERHFSEVLHIWDDGTSEYQRFHGAYLIDRRNL